MLLGILIPIGLLISLRALRLDSRAPTLHVCINKCFKRMYERVVAFLTSAQEFLVLKQAIY